MAKTTSAATTAAPADPAASAATPVDPEALAPAQTDPPAPVGQTSLAKPITGVPDGEIYPREIEAGEECPANLVAYAASIGAFDAE